MKHHQQEAERRIEALIESVRSGPVATHDIPTVRTIALGEAARYVDDLQADGDVLTFNVIAEGIRKLADQPMGYLYTQAELDAAVAAATPSPAPGAGVPPGWKLVPVEPTEEMVNAAVDAEGYEIWTAMLTASPAAPDVQGEKPAGASENELIQLRAQNLLLVGLYDEVAKLVKAKGRYHTEQNYRSLVAAFDLVRTADAGVPPAQFAASQAPQTAAAEAGWVSVDDHRKPQLGQMVLLYVRTLHRGCDDEGNEREQEGAEVAMGEFRVGSEGEYFDCYTSPMSDNDWITHWMPLPSAPATHPTKDA